MAPVTDLYFAVGARLVLFSLISDLGIIERIDAGPDGHRTEKRPSLCCSPVPSRLFVDRVLSPPFTLGR